ncbi:class I SAM-dependent methyltransferase [Campylobacter majalis]|uniref:class I SAM-dependent methyltransferase n=1 Tax=Campylobacter majalis TaxID=2790656 RepID=UPI003D68D029
MYKIDFSDGISETLLINLYMRSLDFKSDEPILSDAFSGDVVSGIDYDFTKFNKSKMSRVGIVIRAKFFDNEAMKFYLQNENVVIVQVGSGLDTRPLRLEGICKNAYFYDIDLPDVITLRENLIPKAKNNFYIASSMFETAWMDELASKHKGAKFCFILEGIAMYFNNEMMSGFFRNLGERFDGVIMLDFLNKFMAKQMSKGRHDVIKFMKNRFDFYGIDDISEVLVWSDKLSHVKTAKIMNMYKSHWGVGGFIGCFIPQIVNANKMFVFELKRNT